MCFIRVHNLECLWIHWNFQLVSIMNCTFQGLIFWGLTDRWKSICRMGNALNGLFSIIKISMYVWGMNRNSNYLWSNTNTLQYTSLKIGFLECKVKRNTRMQVLTCVLVKINALAINRTTISRVWETQMKSRQQQREKSVYEVLMIHNRPIQSNITSLKIRPVCG